MKAWVREFAAAVDGVAAGCRDRREGHAARVNARARTLKKRQFILLTAAAILPTARYAEASTTYYYDGGASTPTGTVDGISEGSSGTWTTSVQNWDTGLAHVAWPSQPASGAGYVADFAGSAGSGTLGQGSFVVGRGASIAADGIVFESTANNYTGPGTGNGSLTLGNISSQTGFINGLNSSGLNEITGAITTVGNDTFSQVAGGTLTTTGAIANTGNTLTLSPAGFIYTKTVVGGTVHMTGSGTEFFGGQPTDSAATGTFGTASNTGTSATVDSGLFYLDKTNSATVFAIDGTLTITGGRVQLGASGSANQISPNSTVTMSGGTFDMLGQSDGIENLSGTGGSITTTGALGGGSTLTIGSGTAPVSTTYGGVISENTGVQKVFLTKIGASALTLTGTNTYSGATTLTAGALIINGSIANTTTTIGAGTATLGGSGTVGPIIRATDGGNVSPGANNSIATLTATSWTWNGNSSTTNVGAAFVLDSTVGTRARSR